MTREDDPFDKTIWDPNDPEQAIEDPFHGPSATIELLSIPPFRNEDGTYYVFGGTHLPCRTCDFDAEGKPFVKIKTAGDPSFMREILEHQKWVEAHYAGELPPREELDYPEFQYGASPYFIVGSETLPPIIEDI